MLELGRWASTNPALDVRQTSDTSDQVGDLGCGVQHGRGCVLGAEEVEVDVGEADVVAHQELASSGDEPLLDGSQSRQHVTLVQLRHLGRLGLGVLPKWVLMVTPITSSM